MTIFREISWPFVFQRLRVFETDFCFKKTQISQFDIMKYSSFLNFVFCKRRCNCRKLIVFSCLQFADYYIWPRILSCGVIFVLLNHYYGIPFSLKSFPKGIMVLSKTCVRFRNRIFKKFEWVYDQIIFFSCDFWVKDFSSPLRKKFLKTFPFWVLTFFLF